MANRRITIELNTNTDTFKYQPLLPKVRRGTGSKQYTGVEWRCRVNGRQAKTFAIHFAGGSPCNKGRERTTNGTIQLDLNDHMRGRFKYFVAVADRSGRIWTDDPDIIVW